MTSLMKFFLVIAVCLIFLGGCSFFRIPQMREELKVLDRTLVEKKTELQAMEKEIMRLPATREKNAALKKTLAALKREKSALQTKLKKVQ